MRNRRSKGKRAGLTNVIRERSAFYVTIPFQVAREIIDDTASPPEAGPREDLPPLDILLVEDQKMNQIFTVDLLTSHGPQ
jgi:hypothetical protein